MKSDFLFNTDMNDFRITFSDGGMKFKDITVVLPTKMLNLIEILGKPSRILDSDKETGNKFYFWDDLGIYTIEEVNSEIVVQISIAINKNEYQEEFYPLSMYDRDIKIEEFTLNKKTSLTQLKKTDMFVSESLLFFEKKLGKCILDVELGDNDEILTVGFSLS